MQHKADIGLVDAHAERDRRADHAHFIAQEQFLVLGPLSAFGFYFVSRGHHWPGAETVAPYGGAAFHDNKVWVKKA